ncbi:hypothetical protein [Hasllibacter sp. MH4015]|uniref:hypothetical protein n=1 Tax=Hasllibacter sp. MH4015 TaxID=2854029 RepID=UPI001CD7F541|nr:hypothetical protein [Hasllibacter sp. MH4015]
MPPITPLALRYLLWLIGLRILYVGAVNFLGLPNSLATTVILAAAPAMDIGVQAVRRATRALMLRDWAILWAVLVAIYAILNIAIPAILVAEFRAILTGPDGLRGPLIVACATAAMIALFLWIGARTGRGQQAP